METGKQITNLTQGTIGVPTSLIEFLENTERAFGDKTAVEAEDGSLTFHQLRGAACNIAVHIGKLVPACVPVLLYLPKGSVCFSALLGVLYSGNCYVPMDVRAPIQRTKAIWGQLDEGLILTNQRLKPKLVDNGIPESVILTIEETIGSPVQNHADRWKGRIGTDPACIIFTSGSTGCPKGVVIPHNRLIDYIVWARDYFHIDENTIIGSQAPFFFTVASMDLYLCLLAGAKLCVFSEHTLAAPSLLLEAMEKKQVNFIFWVPTLYENIAESGELPRYPLPSLKQALFVGEPMKPKVINLWLDCFPQVQFFNLYGSTEVDMALCYPISSEERFSKEIPLPLGFPRRGADALILGQNGAKAKEGELGELCIRGNCLALGYWKDKEKSGRAFCQNPLQDQYSERIYRTGDLAEYHPSKGILFHGRKDNQFKFMGYRIESEEIELVAESLPWVKSACVQYDETNNQIVLLYTGEAGKDNFLRKGLMERLPLYMVPTKYRRLERLPVSANGKKDRVKIKELLKG